MSPPGEEDLFDQDGAFGIERILYHAVDDDGIVQFKVRYFGFGPKDDLWYDEDVMAKLLPDLVADYKERVEAKLGGTGGSQRRQPRWLRQRETMPRQPLCASSSASAAGRTRPVEAHTAAA